MTVKIDINHAGKPAGKLADAELHFDGQDGPLNGLRLVGFAVWQRPGSTARRVTFPARRFSLAGQQRSYGLLRPITEAAGQAVGQDKVRELILSAYEARLGQA